MHHLRHAVVTLTLGLSLALPAHASRSVDAREVLGRLLAPCCWNQTLDIHDSDLATRLRVEISTRLTAGEPPSVIEDDLARRFGERIRAVPRGQDPRESMALVLLSVMTMLLLALFALAFRWTRRRAATRDDRALDDSLSEAQDAQYEARLDGELARTESALR